MSQESIEALPGDESSNISEELKSQIAKSARAMYLLTRQGANGQQMDYFQQWDSLHEVRPAGSDPKINEYCQVGVIWWFNPDQPSTKFYNMTVEWYDKPDTEQSLHKVQYDFRLAPESRLAYITEPDLATELLKTDVAPGQVTRPMTEYDHRNLQQLAGYILLSEW